MAEQDPERRAKKHHTAIFKGCVNEKYEGNIVREVLLGPAIFRNALFAINYVGIWSAEDLAKMKC